MEVLAVSVRWGRGHTLDYTLPFSLTGQPCVVVPSGRSKEGLPIGVQVVGQVWREDVALAAALCIESTVGGWRKPPI